VIRVLLAEDHSIVRAGLEDLLSNVEDIAVVGAAADGAEAVTLAAEHRPDVVLMDLLMPALDGTEATRRIVDADPCVRVVVLTSFSDSERILDALDAGAVGYLLKDAEPEDIIKALRDAAAGGVPLSPKAARALLPGNRPAGNASTDALTPREREVLALMAEGRSNSGIAHMLWVSEGAVEKHVTNIFSKLQLPPTTEDHRRVLAVLRYLRA